MQEPWAIFDWKVPDAQLVQAADLGAEYLPMPQLTQPIEAEAPVMVPAMQFIHAVDPSVGWYEPEEQLVQLVEAVFI